MDLNSLTIDKEWIISNCGDCVPCGDYKCNNCCRAKMPGCISKKLTIQTAHQSKQIKVWIVEPRHRIHFAIALFTDSFGLASIDISEMPDGFINPMNDEYIIYFTDIKDQALDFNKKGNNCILVTTFDVVGQIYNTFRL